MIEHICSLIDFRMGKSLSLADYAIRIKNESIGGDDLTMTLIDRRDHRFISPDGRLELILAIEHDRLSRSYLTSCDDYGSFRVVRLCRRIEEIFCLLTATVG